jgi:hypothetical protein
MTSIAALLPEASIVRGCHADMLTPLKQNKLNNHDKRPRPQISEQSMKNANNDHSTQSRYLDRQPT